MHCTPCTLSSISQPLIPNGNHSLKPYTRHKAATYSAGVFRSSDRSIMAWKYRCSSRLLRSNDNA